MPAQPATMKEKRMFLLGEFTRPLFSAVKSTAELRVALLKMERATALFMNASEAEVEESYAYSIARSGWNPYT